MAIHESIVFGSGGPAASPRAAAAGSGDAGDAEADDERAALEQVAAGQRAGRCIGVDGVHRVAPAIVVDASWIAFMMRG